jgi:hypothetical protein
VTVRPFALIRPSLKGQAPNGSLPAAEHRPTINS